MLIKRENLGSSTTSQREPTRLWGTLSRTARLLGVLVVTAGFLTTPAGAAEKVKIGVLLPLTGAVADLGSNSRQGMIWAAEQINERGGIDSLGGAKLNLVFADTQSKSNTGISAMQKLLSVSHVPVVTGAFQSSVTLSTTRLAERAHVPYLVFSSLADDITERGFDYTFRAHVSAKSWAAMQFNFMDWLNAEKAEEMDGKIEEIAFLYENTAYGQSTAQNWKALAPERGYEVVADLSYSHGASNVTSVINRVCSANPDAVLLVSYLADALLIARTQQQLGCSPSIQIGTGAGHSDVKFARSNYGVNGLFTAANWNRDLAKDFNEFFVDSYTDRWGMMPTSHAAQGMMNIYILKEVLEDAGAADPEAIRKALEDYRTTNVPPAISGAEVIEFNAAGQNTHIEVIMTQIQNSEYSTVYPPNAASTQPVLPTLEQRQE